MRDENRSNALFSYPEKEKKGETEQKKSGEVTEQKEWQQLADTFSGSCRLPWFNLGGQLILQNDLEELAQQIRQRQLGSWREIHEYYSKLSRNYLTQNAANAFATLMELHGTNEASVDQQTWQQWLSSAVEITHEMAQKTRESRQKDFTNPFRQITFDSQKEMEAVMGHIDANVFVQKMETEAQQFEQRVVSWLTDTP